MSVQKNFRFDEYTNALLQQLADKYKTTQTMILDELIQDYVMSLDKEESIQIIKDARRSIKTL